MKKRKSDNVLLYIPKIKHRDWEIKNKEVYLVFYHKKLIERFIGVLFKKPLVTDIKLDEVGSFIWKHIDGKKTVLELGEKLKSHFGEKCEPIYNRLIMYLKYLNRMGWIAFERGNQK